MSLPRRAGILAALVPFLIAPVFVLACTCADSAIHLEGADTVFRGFAIRQVKTPGWTAMYQGKRVKMLSSGDPVRWYFVPTSAWRGQMKDTVLVYTPGDGAACGVGFQEGVEYLVVGSSMRTKGSIWSRWPSKTDSVVCMTSICTGTGPVRTTDLSVLGAPTWAKGQ